MSRYTPEHIEQAIKLEELVKARMRVVEDMDINWIDYTTGKELHPHILSPIYNELKSMVEESQVTLRGKC